MIVIGVDVHKHSLTAVAVDKTGRPLAERPLRSAEDGRLAWASALDSERARRSRRERSGMARVQCNCSTEYSALGTVGSGYGATS